MLFHVPAIDYWVFATRKCSALHIRYVWGCARSMMKKEWNARKSILDGRMRKSENATKRWATITFSSLTPSKWNDNGWQWRCCFCNTDDDVMVTMNNCEATALASLSFLAKQQRAKKTNERKKCNVKSDMIEMTICGTDVFRGGAISNSLFRRLFPYAMPLKGKSIRMHEWCSGQHGSSLPWCTQKQRIK